MNICSFFCTTGGLKSIKLLNALFFIPFQKDIGREVAIVHHLDAQVHHRLADEIPKLDAQRARFVAH